MQVAITLSCLAVTIPWLRLAALSYHTERYHRSATTKALRLANIVIDSQRVGFDGLRYGSDKFAHCQSAVSQHHTMLLGISVLLLVGFTTYFLTKWYTELQLAVKGVAHIFKRFQEELKVDDVGRAVEFLSIKSQANDSDHELNEERGRLNSAYQLIDKVMDEKTTTEKELTESAIKLEEARRQIAEKQEVESKKLAKYEEEIKALQAINRSLETQLTNYVEGQKGIKDALQSDIAGLKTITVKTIHRLEASKATLAKTTDELEKLKRDFSELQAKYIESQITVNELKIENAAVKSQLNESCKVNGFTLLKLQGVENNLKEMISFNGRLTKSLEQ
ncbi:hypothetical protein HDE_06498 [Halotydeus destructor]|nr:hypothetical protein HDE_06498 [Halotydeus destructor]